MFHISTIYGLNINLSRSGGSWRTYATSLHDDLMHHMHADRWGVIPTGFTSEYQISHRDESPSNPPEQLDALVVAVGAGDKGDEPVEEVLSLLTFGRHDLPQPTLAFRLKKFNLRALLATRTRSGELDYTATSRLAPSVLRVTATAGTDFAGFAKEGRRYL